MYVAVATNKWISTLLACLNKKKPSFKVQYITLEKIDHSTYYSFRKKIVNIPVISCYVTFQLQNM